MPRLHYAVGHQVEFKCQCAGPVPEPECLAIGQGAARRRDQGRLLGLPVIGVIGVVQNQRRHRRKPHPGLDRGSIVGRLAQLQLVRAVEHAARRVVARPVREAGICLSPSDHLAPFGEADDHVVDVDAHASRRHGCVRRAEFVPQL